MVLLTLGGLAAGVVLAPPASTSPAVVSSGLAGALAWLLFVGSSVHVAATASLFVLSEVLSVACRDRWRWWWAPCGLIAMASLVSALISPSRLAFLLLVMFAWQFWHYQKQNLGMVALVAASHRVTALTRAERQAIRSAGTAGVVGVVAHPNLLGLSVDLPLGPIWVLAGVLLVASTCYGIALLVGRPGSERPAGFSAMYVLSLLFSAPMFVFESPYAAVGGMTIAHGFQYLALVALVLAGSPSRWSRLVRLGLSLNVALLAGALLSWASHLHDSPVPLRVLFGAYVGVLMTHFVIDGRLWRLRDPAVRAFLVTRVPYLVPACVVPAAGGSVDGIDGIGWR